jgi:hypothetical protein
MATVLFCEQFETCIIHIILEDVVRWVFFICAVGLGVYQHKLIFSTQPRTQDCLELVA